MIIRQERISDRLYHDLLNGILIGDFPPDSKLPTELILAHDYGISRSTVRVALTQLKKEGLVVSRQGAGTVVTEFQNDKALPFASEEILADLEKCFECRIVFEPEISAIVAQRRTSKEISYFQNHINSLVDLVQTGSAYTAEDTDFHLRLASLSGNKFFESIMNSLRPHILLGMNLVKIFSEQAREEHTRLSLQEHRKIVDALSAGDPVEARLAMRDHLERSHQCIFRKD